MDHLDHAGTAGEPPFHINQRKATRTERLAALSVALLSLAAVLITLPNAKEMLQTVPPFLPMFIAVVFLLDITTAFLLFSEFRASRRLSVAVLAGCYLYAALITIPHILTFPGVFTASGLLHAGSQTAVWLWVMWHGGFPLLLMLYMLADRYRPEPMPVGQARRTALLVALAAASLVVAAVWVAVAFNDQLPVIIQRGNFRILVTSGVGPVVWLLNLGALLLLWFRIRGRPVVGLWLTVASFAFLLDVTLTLFSGARYSAGWYVARIISVLSAGLVMSKMLLELRTLYYRTQQLYNNYRWKSEDLAELNRRMRQDQEHINSLLESTREGMIMCDAGGRVLFANERCAALLHRPCRIGGTVEEWLKELKPGLAPFEPLKEALADVLEGREAQAHMRAAFQGPAGVKYLEFYAVRVRAVSETAAGDRLIVISDRSEEEALNERKMEFVSIVSHELRTPLTSIRGFVELLLNREVDRPTQEKYLTTVLNEASRLSELLDDFLDLQRLEAGRLEYVYDSVELGALVEGTAEQWAGKQPHGIRLRHHSRPVRVRADSDKLRQVLHNLISNAIKYSPGADHIDISVEAEGHQAVVRIRDYGLGIPDDAKPKIFTKFYRVDNSDRRKIGGTGLGLAIVKDIMEAHGGTVSFDSVFGQGTTFTFTLPLERSEG